MIIKYIRNILILFLIVTYSAMSQHWKKIDNIPVPYNENYWLDVFFLPSNPQYGWITGFNGMVIRTTDGGNSWQGSTIQNAYHMEHVMFLNTSIGYVSGVDGIFKSIDGGVTWTNVTPIDSIYNIATWGSFFIDINDGVLLGGGCGNLPQVFWRTTNGGSSWSVFVDEEFNTGLTDAIILEKDGLGYASSSGKIWRTTDGGSTWEIFSSLYADPLQNVWQEEIAKYGNTFLVPFAGVTCSGEGNTGGMHISTNLGSTWSSFTTGSKMFGAFLLNETTGWASGYNQSVYYTSNSGNTWELRNCGISNAHLDDLWFVNSNVGWVVGQGVWKLSPSNRFLTRDTMDFKQICVPEVIMDTVWLKNYSFQSIQASAQILGGGGMDMQLLSPNNPNFREIAACDSLAIIVRFAPTSTGYKHSTISIVLLDENLNEHNLIVHISGIGVKPTAKPNTNELIIDSALVGVETESVVVWTADFIGEYIEEFVKISGPENIRWDSFLPRYINAEGTSIRFYVTPSDTGWTTAEFKFKLGPCENDTIIKIRIYGISPIIEADDSFISLECDNFKLDTIPVFNNGNSDLIIPTVNLTNTSNFQFIRWTSGNSLPNTIEPKSSDSLIIRFSASLPGTYETNVILKNNDSTKTQGNKNPLIFTVSGSFHKTEIKANRLVIDFGTVCVGDTLEQYFELSNDGNLDAFLLNPELLFPDFLFSYIDGEVDGIWLDSGDVVNCKIQYIPKNVETITREFYIKSMPCGDSILITLIAKSENAEIEAIPDFIEAIMQVNVPLEKQIQIKSHSSINVLITDIYLVDNLPDTWSFSFEPQLPIMLLPNGQFNFNFEFLAEEEAELNTFLCFKAQGICNAEVCIPITLRSYSGWLDISKLSLDFGRHYCEPVTLLDTIYITNSGSIQDTITRLELLPSLPEFQILNMPSLPLYLDSDEVFELVIRYQSQSLGGRNSTLFIQSNNTQNRPFEISITSFFGNTATSIQPEELFFDAVEFCLEPVTKIINFSNTGNIADTLSITKQNDIEGFIIEDLEYIIVPENGGTAQISVTANPALFDGTGFYEEVYIFNSNVCQSIFTCVAQIDLIEPMLLVSPSELDFGSVWLEDEATLQVMLENAGNLDLRIDAITLEPEDIFGIEELEFPFVIKANETSTISISFLAQSIDSNLANLRISFSSECNFNTELAMKAYVPREVYNIDLKISEYEAEPGEIISIAIELLSSNERLKPNSIDFEVQFDQWLFEPEAVSVKNNELYADQTYDYQAGVISGKIEKQYAEQLLTQASDILIIQGRVLVSNPPETPLRITRFEPEVNKEMLFSKVDGVLRLIGFCPPIGDFKFQMMPEVKISLANSIIEKSDLIINYSVGKDQKLEIAIFNASGVLVLKQEVQLSKSNNQLSFPIENLSTGFYIVNFYVNKKIKREKLLIIH